MPKEIEVRLIISLETGKVSFEALDRQTDIPRIAAKWFENRIHRAEEDGRQKFIDNVLGAITKFAENK